jgi:predicted transporter
VLQRRRVRHDHVVWALVLGPLIACGVLMPLTAPMAMAYTAWKWRSAESVVSRVRLRMALAMPVALVELGVGIWLWSEIFGR